MLGWSKLKIQELASVLTEAEATLNCWPLMYMNSIGDAPTDIRPTNFADIPASIAADHSDVHASEPSTDSSTA